MRNTIKYAALIITLVIIIPGILGNIESHYTREATVIHVNHLTDEVKVSDLDNRQWSFVGSGYHVGDKVSMTMNTRHTDNIISDDTIESVKIITKH